MTEPIDVHTAVLMLETKLRRPTVSTQHVARPRLLEQLNASADRQLILVSAPAGYGKTALVSRWLDAVDCPCAWFSVDEHDDDLAAFLLYLVAAIRAVYHDAMGAIELLLQAPTLLAPHRLADALLQDMAALPGPFILAFDDYHTVNAPAIHALMARLVERLPAQVHLVLITRADPPLPLVRLRGRQQLGEIRAADLRFSAEETGLLLQQLLGSGVTAETAALLEESTEGWAVGLHLAALSLRNRTDPAAFARQIAAQGHQAITEYLLSEVLAGLPAAQRDCLLQSALFDRFCAPLIDAAQAEGDGKLAGDDFLRAIRRANLFVVSLDDEGNLVSLSSLLPGPAAGAAGSPVYTLRRSRPSTRAPAAWFSAQGLVDEAILHSLAAGDPIACRLAWSRLRCIRRWIVKTGANSSTGSASCQQRCQAGPGCSWPRHGCTFFAGSLRPLKPAWMRPRAPSGRSAGRRWNSSCAAKSACCALPWRTAAATAADGAVCCGGPGCAPSRDCTTRWAWPSSTTSGACSRVGTMSMPSILAIGNSKYMAGRRMH